jgi:metal-responsive CopG/Arc/MetJ family transcriptional regulator
MAKVMVSLPDDLLSEIDEEATRRDISRSGFLADAARTELHRRAPETIEAAVRRSQERFSHASPFDSIQLIRQERDARP